MQHTLQNILALLAVIAIVGALVFFSGERPASGSVSVTDEYRATTTTSTLAGTTLEVVPGNLTRGCTLGSLIIASSSATTFTLYNATSTSDVSSTTIATFVANAPEATYTFDVLCNRGLIIEAPANFNGMFVTTFR